MNIFLKALLILGICASSVIAALDAEFLGGYGASSFAPTGALSSITTTNRFIYTNATGFIAAQLDESGNVTNYLFQAGTNSANFAF